VAAADGIDFGCGGAYAHRQPKKEPRGFVWLKSKFKNVHIRVATVRRHRAASIAERTVRAPRTVRLSRAAAGMRSVRRDKRCTRNKNRDLASIPNGCRWR